MIRKTIIVMLTLAAVGVASLQVVCLFRSISYNGHGYQVGFVSSLVAYAETRSSVSGWYWHLPDRCYELQYLWPITARTRNGLLVAVPMWMLFCLFAAYPAIAYVRGPMRRWRRRRKHGLCAKCGYDLRGLTKPRCPECGMQFDASTEPFPPN